MGQGLSSGLRAVLLGAALALAACASNPPAPVEDRSSGDTAPAPARDRGISPAAADSGVVETYRVAKGDTLYAIAFKRGIDFKELASWNNIAAPYRIFVGQELRLRAPAGYVAPTVAAAAPAVAAAPEHGPSGNATEPAAASGTTTSGLSTPSGKPQPSMFEDVPPVTGGTASNNSTGAAPPGPAPNAASAVAGAKPAANDGAKPPVAVSKPPPEASAKPPVAAVGANEPTGTSKPVEATPAAAPPPSTAKPGDTHAAELNAGGVRWRWPGAGKVVGTFVGGDPTRQGIDIAGKSGDPVAAAADGEVVYSGNGLLGYGELIIIKHNASFLSAYGHNRARLVKEGDKVKAGQQIAEMGSSASAREELHFEIRKNGKPVNPLDFLPVR